MANPLAAISSLSMLFKLSLGLDEEAAVIDKAIDATLSKGYRTIDIFSDGNENIRVNTSEMTDQIIEIIENPNKSRVPKPL